MAGNGTVLVGVTCCHGYCMQDPTRVLGCEHRGRLLVAYLDQLTMFGAGPMDYAA